MRILLFYLAAFLLPYSLLAQPMAEKSTDIDIALGARQKTLSLAFARDFLVGRRDNIVLGFGVRFTGYSGTQQYYVTAPAQLTSGAKGPHVIFKRNIVANMDSLLVSRPVVVATNLYVNLGYKFSGKLSAGFNIDVFGISAGRQVVGTYINGSSTTQTTANVTSWNVLLVSDNDRGTLNSELYAKYWLGRKISLRGGVQFLFTEYTTGTEVQQFPEPNDRFRRKSLMFMIGTSLRF
jgi:hypothetical protein